MVRLLLFLTIMISGCSSDSTPVVSQYRLKISTDDAINPTGYNDANPVVIRIYQLTDQQMFNQLPFIDLYNNDVQLLAANLVSKQVLPVALPKTTTDVTLDINKNTQYLAVLVEFANYQQSEPKSVSTLPGNDDQYLQLSVSGLNATLEIITPDSSWWQIF
ncbi:type VI secretion system lipoprotein TssJ [Vibrio sp. NTOU-M3]|uniref:type VI secretion system lipoprotein TssJ n=1 Tax=Vibrio sp. NTOU-M3 TaxID=3234954 RepID=UPI00349F4F33